MVFGWPGIFLGRLALLWRSRIDPVPSILTSKEARHLVEAGLHFLLDADFLDAVAGEVHGERRHHRGGAVALRPLSPRSYRRRAACSACQSASRRAAPDSRS